MSRRASVPPDVKAQAIADLLTGEQPAVVAERYKVPRETVKSWRRRLDLPAHAPANAPAPMHAPAPAQPVRYPSIEARQAQVVELVYETLIAKLTATQRLAEHVTRDEWLDKQSASGIAELGGWLDSTARATLELLARPAGDAPADEVG